MAEDNFSGKEFRGAIRRIRKSPYYEVRVAQHFGLEFGMTPKNIEKYVIANATPQSTDEYWNIFVEDTLCSYAPN